MKIKQKIQYEIKKYNVSNCYKTKIVHNFLLPSALDFEW